MGEAREFEVRQSAAVFAAYARGMSVSPDVFRGGGLTIAPRPADSPWPFVAFVVTAPGGTLACFAPEALAWARANQPASPAAAAEPAFLIEVLAASGARAAISAPELSWSLAHAPGPGDPPAGVQLESRDPAWMLAEMDAGRFPNGVGTAGANARETRNRYAVVLLDSRDEPVAVAGVHDTFGLSEIGVDVVPGRQSEGLGTAVVNAAVREILARGDIPFYSCSATNIRSQRTARACGFVPAFYNAALDPLPTGSSEAP